MKKFLALLLSVLMLLTVTASFAEDAVEPSTTGARFTKKYTGAIPVGDTLTFKTEFVMNQTTGSTTDPEILPDNITLNVTEDADGVFDVPFTVTAPAEYGTYIYKITEDTTNANSYVKYDTEALFIGVLYTASELTVTLINDPNATATTDFVVEDRAEDVEPEENPDGKKDQFVNQYYVGSFEVTKVITGNAANLNDRFVVEVTFTSDVNLDNLAMTWSLQDDENDTENLISTITSLKAGVPATMNIEIGHNETIFFDMVPVGVKVSVEETKQVGKGDLNFYTATYEGNDITIAADGSSQTITITNNKETEIPTGVQLDSIPYIVLLAVAVLGVVGFVVKRRMAAADEE